jgi:Beta-galactosidase/beta-glucuronidase
MRKILPLILVCFIHFAGQAQINYSHKIRLNDNWEFLKSDLGNVWEAVRPASIGSPEMVPIWEKVTVPHCFNATDAVDPNVNYYQGPGWYRTHLTIENPYDEGRTLLHFEGAGQKTTVFIYTEEVGSHVGGYDEWEVDITDAVKRFQSSDAAKRFGGKIPLSIRCDNTRDTEMIPSDLSDFNLYGGIYRYLNLVYTPQLALTSVRIDALVDQQGKKGELKITGGFTGPENRTGEVNIKVYSPGKKLIKEENSKLNGLEEQQLFSVSLDKPELWSTDNPALYSCEITLRSESGTMRCEEMFGFRHFEFVRNGPFLLNNERLLLRGTHRHEDHAGVAAAMTEEMIVKEMELMKSMGVNFIRLGHYQQSRIVLEQCDRLGILVWEEIPWCRGGLGGAIYKEQARRMLTNMITQHRNHPSVILWGLGNENDWPNDFPEFDKEKIRAFMSELHELSHKLDDTRLTAIRRCDFCKDMVDVYSPSIWAGWYRGIYTDYKNVSYDEMQQTDHFLHVEWGGDSHARRHAEDPYIPLDKIDSEGVKADERAGDASLYGGTARASRDGDWSESYICDLIDWHLKEQETMPWLTGAAYWPFKDFSTPVRPENPVPYMNQKGVVERDFTPKESFYVFQSYWTEKPMIRIYGHSWPTRWGSSGEQKTIKVYSNCDEAELFLNDKSLGVKKRNSQDFPAAGLRWNTAFLSGKNRVKVVGKKGGETVEDAIVFEYETRPFGEEAKVSVKIVESTDEYAWIEAELQDQNGVPCLMSAHYIYFDSVGDGYLIENMGTSTASGKVQAYNGRARIKLVKRDGKNLVSVKSDGLETVFVKVE